MENNGTPALAAPVSASNHVGSVLMDAYRAASKLPQTVATIGTSTDPQLCECGNHATIDGLCEWCDAIKDEPKHLGHWTHMGGQWFCDTCDSPLCDLA